MTAKRSKKLWFLTNAISWVLLLVPVIIYNAINHDAFKHISVTKYTFTFLVALSMIGLAALVKMKDKTSIWLVAIGCVLAIMGDMAIQIGWSLLMIGGSMLVDVIILNPLRLKFKEEYYVATGKSITYTREIK